MNRPNSEAIARRRFAVRLSGDWWAATSIQDDERTNIWTYGGPRGVTLKLVSADSTRTKAAILRYEYSDDRP